MHPVRLSKIGQIKEPLLQRRGYLMSLINKSLCCFNCGSTFTFTAEEQVFPRSKGNVYEKQFCPFCGQVQKAHHNIGLDGRRKMYTTICVRCSKDTKVPFEPRNDMPVYCSDCYSWVAQSRY
ncbi:CxxC-x17-CxxC domain-containing protein [Chloroflexota bacterium]